MEVVSYTYGGGELHIFPTGFLKKKLQLSVEGNTLNVTTEH
jgi:hypothetical protein